MRTYADCFVRRLQLLVLVFMAMAAMDSMPSFIGSVEGKTVDLDTTLALSPEAFWSLAQSESFYRSSRVQEKNISQKIVELGKWVPKGGRNIMDKVAFAFPSREAVAPAQNLHLKREAHLVNSVSSPLGLLETNVDQDQTLAVQNGVMTYVTVDSIKGVPLVRGDMVVKTTVNVTSKEDSPDKVTVRIIVNVGDIKLPVMLRWLKGKMASSIHADGLKQANKWLDQMVAAKAQGNP